MPIDLTSMRQKAAAAVARREGESITYRTAAGVNSTINAVVIRHPLEKQNEDAGNSLASPITIEIQREDIAAVTPHGDTVKLPKNNGDDPTWHTVNAILGQDPQVWTLGVGR